MGVPAGMPSQKFLWAVPRRYHVSVENLAVVAACSLYGGERVTVHSPPPASLSQRMLVRLTWTVLKCAGLTRCRSQLPVGFVLTREDMCLLYEKRVLQRNKMGTRLACQCS